MDVNRELLPRWTYHYIYTQAVKPATKDYISPQPRIAALPDAWHAEIGSDHGCADTQSFAPYQLQGLECCSRAIACAHG